MCLDFVSENVKQTTTKWHVSPWWLNWRGPSPLSVVARVPSCATTRDPTPLHCHSDSPETSVHAVGPASPSKQLYCYRSYKTNPSPSFPVQPSLVCLSMLSVNPLLQWTMMPLHKTKRYKSWLSYSAIPGVTSVPFCAVSQVDGLHERTLSRKTASQLFWGPFLIAGPLQSWPKFLQFSPHCRNILNWNNFFIIF